MKTNDEIISDLNSLVNILNDGKKGYDSAAETTDSLELKAVFEKDSIERAAYAAELKAHIKTHGGNEDGNESGGLLGAVHRGWIDIKQAFTGNDNKSILEAIETGEKAAIEKYDGFIADYTDHADHLALLQKQRNGIQQDLNQIESLKAQFS
ncbi:MAG: PA2169 family four-helix-bundle protein [Mucilaginibacter sp.]|uniref:ferritin-like domain-containing protein n=1 Tax=Mucilaginibacter sp. TaxID=1882438 RepID=UPI0034E453B1